jgi:Zn-dependent membrane protease YugP
MCKECGCSAQSSNTKIQFFVKGYKEDTVAEVERTLLGLPGVYHVHIHAHDGETTIDYNPAKTRLSEMTAIFSERGLDAVI